MTNNKRIKYNAVSPNGGSGRFLGIIARSENQIEQRFTKGERECVFDKSRAKR